MDIMVDGDLHTAADDILFRIKLKISWMKAYLVLCEGYVYTGGQPLIIDSN